MQRSVIRILSSLGTCAAASALATAALAQEAPLAPRFEVAMAGRAKIIGHTMGFDCGANGPKPIPAGADCTGTTNTDDSSPDIYWRDDLANVTINPSAGPLFEPRTSVSLDLPPGANVLRAQLYWGARRIGLTADGAVSLLKPDGTSSQVDADISWSIPTPDGVQSFYQATADVTTLVQASGAGLYGVEFVDAIPLPQAQQESTYAAWTLVAVFAAANHPGCKVTAYDGFDLVDASSTSVNLDKLTVPTVPNPGAFLTIVGYEGDDINTTDTVRLNNVVLPGQPPDNFFNSTRSCFGQPCSYTEAHPPTSAVTGAANHMSGYDLDLIDVTPLLNPGQTGATLTVSSQEDNVILGLVVTETCGCTTDAECTNPALPACHPELGGECRECSNTNKTRCTPESGKPICDSATWTCVACLVGDDSSCVGNPDGPHCRDDGAGPHCGCFVHNPEGEHDTSASPAFTDTTDQDCGNLTSGRVCDNQSSFKCIPGCRGEGFGNQCEPGDRHCTSDDEAIGICAKTCVDASECEPATPRCCDFGEGLKLCVECCTDDDCPAERPICGAQGRCGFPPPQELVIEGGGGCTIVDGGRSRGLGLVLGGGLASLVALVLRRRGRRRG